MHWKSSSTTVSGAPSLATPFTSSITALSRTPPGRLQALQGAAAQAAAYAVDRQGDTGPEPQRIVVADVERHPGDVARAAGVPRAGRNRLPVARRGRDESERHVVSLESLLDAWARDHLGPQPGREQLRLGEWKRLVFGAGGAMLRLSESRSCRHDPGATRGATSPHPHESRRFSS